MGGFGALKYAAKYYGHFASVSAHSGPASLRRDFGLVVHWANITSAVLDLAGGTVYGAPLWDQARVSADNPVERLESYRNKRIFLVAGTSPDPINPFDSVNETQVLAGQREFRAPPRTPASRMNRTRSPADTSFGPTCPSGPRRHRRPAAPRKQRRSRRRTRRYTLTSRVGRESGTRAEQLGNWSKCVLKDVLRQVF